MYRVIDNENGKVLAIVFEEKYASMLVHSLPIEELEEGFYRYAWEDCLQSPSAALIGNTLLQLGEAIQDRKYTAPIAR